MPASMIVDGRGGCTVIYRASPSDACIETSHIRAGDAR